MESINAWATKELFLCWFEFHLLARYVTSLLLSLLNIDNRMDMECFRAHSHSHSHSHSNSNSNSLYLTLTKYIYILCTESWKYGTRAFRYCQHDLGHAIAAIRLSAQMNGWNMIVLNQVTDDQIR